MTRGRILYLTPGCFDKGGISRYNRYQIAALRELRGASNVRVISLAGRRADDFEDSFTVYWSGSGPNLTSKIRLSLVLLWQIIWWRPGVVWVGHVNLSGLTLLFASLTGTRVILNTYGLEVWSGLKTSADWGLRNAHVVMADCNYTARYLEDSGYRKPGSTAVIWDCVDLLRFFPSVPNRDVWMKYGLPDPGRYPLVVTLGRIARVAAHKGYDRLLHAFVRVYQTLPTAYLVLAGKGDLIPELQDLAKNLGIADRVIFAGMIEEKHLADIYRCARVFSLVSDRGKGRGEGIPLTPLEAMACAVPIIVGNQDGSQEAIIESRNGYCISPNEIEKHGDILLKLLTDQSHHRQLATQAAQVAQESFSYEGFREKHRILIAKVAAA